MATEKQIDYIKLLFKKEIHCNTPPVLPFRAKQHKID